MSVISHVGAISEQKASHRTFPLWSPLFTSQNVGAIKRERAKHARAYNFVKSLDLKITNIFHKWKCFLVFDISVCLHELYTSHINFEAGEDDFV